MSITREQIINALEEKGYKCQSNNVIKNSITLEAINILTETNISPLIYIADIIENSSSLEDAVSKVISIYENHQDFEHKDIVQLLQDKNWLCEHLFIALQKSESDENLIKRDCDDCFTGLEQYLYIRDRAGEEGWSIKLNSSILALANLDECIAWQSAQKNTFAPGEVLLQSLSSLISEMSGCPDLEDIPGIPPLFVLSNRSKVKGSIQVCNKDCIDSFVSSLEESTGKHIVKIAVLPSSLHEVLLYPVFDGDVFDYEDEMSLTNMVQLVNQDSVDPIDRLYDRVFIINL